MPYIERGKRDVASQRDPLGQQSVYIAPGTFGVHCKSTLLESTRN